MKSRTLLWLLPLFCWLAALRAAVLPPKPLEIYERAGRRFPAAVFFKPAEGASNDLAFALAPLILQSAQSSAGDRSRRRDLGAAFGTLVPSNGVPALDRAEPSVYYETDTLEIAGRTHARLSYVWCYRASKEPTQALPMQGVRITLDSQGKPVLWEVLADTSGLRLIFAARSLEDAARAEFGPPLPGRKFALERGLPEARETVVARVIEDGPVPMGPILYLSEKTNAVVTLICRCMPAQASDLLDTRVYNLVSAPMTPRESMLMRARQASGLRPAFWPGSRASQALLEKTLRLPSSF